MSKYCPILNVKVVYLECLECDDKACMHVKSENPTQKPPIPTSNLTTITSKTTPKKE